MTVIQRVMLTLLIVSVIVAICMFRIAHFYPEHATPLAEIAGGMGALVVALPFVWMSRFTQLRGVATVAVPCIGWGAFATVLWFTGEKALALCAAIPLVWYAFDWIKYRKPN